MAFLPGLFGTYGFFGSQGPVSYALDPKGAAQNLHEMGAARRAQMTPEQRAAQDQQGASILNAIPDNARGPSGDWAQTDPANHIPETYGQTPPPFDMSGLLAALQGSQQRQSPFALGGGGMSYGGMNALQFNPTDQLGLRLEGQRQQSLGQLGLGGGLGMMGGRGYF